MFGGNVLVLVLMLHGAYSLNWKFNYNGNDYFMTYSYNEDHYTWYESREQCMKDGGDLATIETVEEDNWIKTKYPGASVPLWIGLNKLSGKWTWADGKTSDIDRWSSGHPKDDLYCAYRSSYYTTTWYSANCGYGKGFMCKRPSGLSTRTPKTTLPTPSVGGYCPQGYMGTSTNKCFKFVGPFTPSITWDAAAKKCREEKYIGANLASINDPAESALLSTLVRKYGLNDDFFIGLKKTSSSSIYPWYWADNTPVTVTNWADDASTTSSGCAYISSGNKPPGSWYNDLYCNDAVKAYVCQILKDPDNTIPTPPPTQPHNCPAGYTPVDDDCYRFVDKEMTWNKAKEYCDDQGASMVYMHSNEEAASVQLQLLLADTKHEAVWTGLYYDDDARQYKWENDWYVLFTRWGPRQPDRSVGGGCVSVLKEDGDWYDEDCSTSLPVMCKKSNGPAITLPPEKPGICLNSQWFELGGHCYFLCYNTGGCNNYWQTQEEECRRMHPTARLASIHDAATNDLLFKRLAAESRSASVWLGLYRSAQDDTWRWSDQAPLQFDNFAAGQPSNSYDFGYMSASGTVEGNWYSYLNNAARGRLCKMDKLRPEPTSAPKNGTCPGDDWVKTGSSCYLYRPMEFRTWNSAQKACLAEGGPDASLAVISTWEENSLIHDSMTRDSDMPITANFWIGLSKADASSSYMWVDGTNATATYAYWARTQPDSATSAHCVQVHYISAQWHNEACTGYLGYACEAPVRSFGSATTPATKAGEGSLSGGDKAGIAIGILIGLGILASLAFLIFKGMTGEPVNLYDRFA